MKKIFAFFCLLSILSAYSQKSFTVSGKLSGFKENALVKITQNNVVLDSCFLKNENFRLKGVITNAPSTVYLQIFSGKEIKYSSLFIGNENITVDADIADFKWNVKTSGSKYDNVRYQNYQLVKDLYFQRTQYENEVNKLRDLGKWNDSLQKQYWSQKEPLGKIALTDKKIADLERKFLSQNINTEYGLDKLQMMMPTLPGTFVSDLIKKINPKMKKTARVKSIIAFFNNKDLKTGDAYFDFTAYDLYNKKHTFSDFFNGKYVLLDFTTLHCGFCLAAVPVLDQLRADIGDQLEIVSFYVDNDLKGLQKMQKKHQTDWIMIWDKKGRLGETYSTYKISGTPNLFLFTPEGKLIEKFDGLYEDLADQIKKSIN
ncbi:alkyl hydroperoxide reductase [Chryseobacterium sp. Leaf180]|uniref:TlpA disulfide reductase family protein n=1 Tax=Chryseobacterium sp. Leaf180 TaxID=1736289 RepID=UPI0006F7AC1E|nr:TlpA disulfide reductase family protein [Chryseobacterium sp. Leaf180]KQR95684.1 alkyl hydroperoxide reductase [Chryseobacterium sp. Leaf180]